MYLTLTYRDNIFSTGLCGKFKNRHRARSTQGFDFLMLQWAQIFVLYPPIPHLGKGQDFISNPSPYQSSYSHYFCMNYPTVKNI